WFLDQLEGPNPTYNVPIALKLDGYLDVDAIIDSLNTVLQRHEVLRTTVNIIDGEPQQKIHSAAKIELPIIDLQSLPEQARNRQLSQLMTQEGVAPFDLSRDLMIRAKLFILAETEFVWVITMHHIASDGWSMEVLGRELAQLYQAYHQGAPDPLPPLPIQYADFATWQRYWLQGEVLDQQLSYWREQLTPLPPLLSLPTDYPRPAQLSYEGARHAFTLPETFITQLKALNGTTNTTEFMALLAAFKIILYRYSGQTDLVVGYPIANRTRPELEMLIGFFVNTLVLRSDLSSDPSFLELLTHIRDVSQQAYEHQDLPFELLVDALQPDRDLSYTPLFQVMFAWQNVPYPQLNLPDLEISQVTVEMPTAKFDLTLEMTDQAGSLTGIWEYNRALFKQTTIERLTTHLQTVFANVLSDPSQPISQIPLLSEAEENQLLAEWNDTQADYPQDRCIHHLFQEQVRRTPEAIAIAYENQRLTFYELNQRANELALYLQSLGVTPDTLVGLYLERSPEMLIGLLGILKAGGAYVPLDPTYPAERLAFMIADAQIQHLLSHTPLQSTIAPLLTSAQSRSDIDPPKVVYLDSDWPMTEQTGNQTLTNDVTATNLAYVIYTSGSTGLPKGVEMPHAPLVNLLTWQTQQATFTPNLKTMQATPLSFDVSFQEIFATWLSGGTLILAPEATRGDRQALLDFLQHHQIERVFAPFVVLQQIAEAVEETGQIPDQLKELLQCGEPLQITPAVANLFQQLPDCTLLNHYGPTESHVVTEYWLQGPVEQWTPRPPIGRPLANIQLYILDHYQQPTPIGVPGELYIGGDCLARGYHNRPDLTAERFVPNPFISDDEQTVQFVNRQSKIVNRDRLYKTGDLARYLDDGTIEFLGRIDHQVKIRGFRIELGEIETVLSEHPSVQACVVVVHQSQNDEKRLVAYLVPVQTLDDRNEITNNQLPITQLRDFLQTKLPDYMIPAAFVQLDQLPLTPNGKVDRLALPAPEYKSSVAYIPPATPTEEQLAIIWQELLDVEQVGRDDNFFEMGGHSLLATQVVAKISSAFEVELPLRRLFEQPTIAGLAQAIIQAAPAKHTLITPADRTQPLALSFAQQRLWFLDKLQGATATYNLPAAIKFEGALNLPVLTKSFNHVIQRHEALRTVFHDDAGSPKQIILEQTTLKLPVIDIQNLSGQTKNNVLTRLIKNEALQPFDLGEDLMLRAKLLVLGNDDHILLITVHHIAADAWSIELLIKEITLLYTAFIDGNEVTLDPLPIQYADFAAWQRAWIGGSVLSQQLAYWQQQLTPKPPTLVLPTDHARSAQMADEGAQIFFTLPDTLSDELRALSHKAGATLYMTLLAAFKVLLYRYTGQTDLMIGSPIANRARPETEKLIGFFINTLLLRTDLSQTPTFLELLERVKEVTQAAYEHQDLPFEMLVEMLQPERDLGQTPLIHVEFVWRTTADTALTLPNVNWHLIESGFALARFDLTLSIQESEGQLGGGWIFNRALFEPQTIARLNEQFQTLLTSLVNQPTLTIDQASLLTANERNRLLVEWNDTRIDYRSHNCLHHIVETQAELTPDSVAVIVDNNHLTYQALNERANQLARHLQSLGVGLETQIGLCLDRSFDMTIAVLAILKTGASYVPLDPTYPTDRLAYMLDNARVSILLTETALEGRVTEIQAVATGNLSKLVTLDTLWPHLTQLSGLNCEAPVLPDNLAYVIYTSGSTGQPKGVSLSHRALTNLVHWLSANTASPRPTRMLQFSPLSFDASFTDMFMTWADSGCLVLIGEQLRYDPELLADLIVTQAVERLNLPYVAFHQLAQTFEARNIWPHSLKEIFSTGEQLQISQAILNLMNNLPNCRLQNQYGPSETHVVTATTLSPSPQEWTVLPDIGQPIANNQIYLLDQQFEPVPIGVAGDLYIGGVNLARGYFGQPALTAERFIPNPFGPGRLYKSGDQARYLPNGHIDFLGRLDHQIKMRGFRIELGEIEAVLSQHEAIKANVVLVYEDQPGNKQLVAYLISQKVTDPDQLERELRNFLQAKLPNYMIPTLFMLLEAFPLTPSGKVDRSAFPSPKLRLTHAYTLPETSTEKRLAEIWVEVLGIDQIGKYDNFFEKGGHSLLATQVVSRIRQTFETDIPLRTLFEQPTLTELAATIRQARQARMSIIEPVSRQEPLPLSFAQQRLWFIEQLEGATPIYNLPAILELTGDLDIPTLNHALNAMIARHEVMRTTFTEQEGQAIQVIHPQAQLDIPSIDLQHLPPHLQAPEVDRLARSEAHQPFDLTQALPLRVKLLVLGQNRYMVFFTMHHIASDGWSISILIREFVALYQAYLQNQPSPLPDLAIQYADFAQWQHQWLQNDILQTQITYWKQQFAELPPALNLPIDYPRPIQRTFTGAHLPFTLPAALTEKLKALSTEHNVTLFMTLLTAFKVLLYRYTHQPDLVVGSAIANRTRPEIEALIGFFVNTLALRSNLADNPTFLTLLEQVKQTTQDAYEHQDLPFELVVEAVQPTRDLSHSPLFQVMFVWQNMPQSSFEIPGLAVTVKDNDTAIARFDLTLIMQEEADYVRGTWEYNTALFKTATIERLASHFEQLLQEIVIDPVGRVFDLQLLTETEQQQILSTWNDTALDFPRDRCLHQIFEDQVEQRPDAIAAVFEEHQLTYEALNSRANQLAHHLQTLGVGPDMFVGVLMERSLEVLTAMFGIFKAGGAYVPLDLAYPADRLAFMVEDTGLTVLITQKALTPILPETSALQIIYIDDDWSLIAQKSTSNPITQVTRRNLAYAIYTSGSTGLPKGVLIEQEGLANQVAVEIDNLNPQPGDRVLQFSSFSFDASMNDIALTLGTGATLCITPQETRLSPELMTTLLQQQATNIGILTPSILALIDPEAVPSLEVIISTGEACPVDVVARWAPTRRLLNGYGPTEVTVGATYWDCVDNGQPPPIGRPFPNKQVYILDTEMQPVPIGVAGEIYIGGVGVARGYLHRSALTAEKFIPDPFSANSGSRLYRTGDLGRYLPNGALEFIGRIDHQVQIRGIRVELGEIEGTLKQHPSVDECVVIAHKENFQPQQLVAYLVLTSANSSDGATIDSDDQITILRQFLQAKLPDHMMPKAFIFLKSLPLTTSGKLDRQALPQPTYQAVTYEAPQTATERSLAAIWSNILEQPEIGRQANFFDLGGHSLLATQIVSRIRQSFQIELPLRTLFEVPTLAALAETVEQAKQMVLPPIEPTSRHDALPLSFAQQRLWFLDQLEGPNPTYNIPTALKLTGSLNIVALRQSLAEIVRRHESLRTNFTNTLGEATQIIQSGLSLKLPIVDLQHLSETAQASACERLAEAESLTPFSLTTDLMIRGQLLVLDENTYILLITMHHIASDGWSIGVLVRELTTLYEAFTQGLPSPLPALAIQYSDFATWQRDWLQGEVLSQQLNHWEQKFAQTPPILTLP
ncbi:MAG: amino acid adenylation domain-containing protein, partial [Chloroflexota bacterium]